MLWAAMSVVMPLLIGIPTFLVIWVPRQRLYYRALPATPLLASGVVGIAGLGSSMTGAGWPIPTYWRSR